ncbi:MAG: putative signal transduction protein with EAL and GGDEF domain [Psychroserpens sp.]|jgi:predicted signal transduction protein with EAL and GGDEF domain
MADREFSHSLFILQKLLFLACLRKLPIVKIKIDRSFIQEVASNNSDVTIVKTMIIPI